MTQDELKTLVGRAAVELVPPGSIVGVGTGSTVDKFIDALAAVRERVAGAVSSSAQSSRRLAAAGIRVLDANEVRSVPVYVDGADEIDPRGCMIKGGGAALTREKILADLADRFICIADQSKQVAVLGRFGLPVEVIEMARERLVRRFAAIAGRAVLRTGVVTDNGHPILDVQGLSIDDPLALESEINQWPGVVACGLFARHRASVALIGTASGVRRIEFDVRSP
jgi:ribose 5-phosphate isomerase A